MYIKKILLQEIGKEFLDVDTWSRLMGHRSWTSQLIALQGYVHAASISEGAYTTSDQIDSTLREQKGNPALDTFTKSLAQYCEGAYARAAETNEQARKIRNEPSAEARKNGLFSE